MDEVKSERAINKIGGYTHHFLHAAFYCGEIVKGRFKKPTLTLVEDNANPPSPPNLQSLHRKSIVSSQTQKINILGEFNNLQKI